MRKRLYKKKYKQNWGVLWSLNVQIDYIKLNSKLFEHTRFTHPKFPHRKWAEARYNEKNFHIRRSDINYWGHSHIGLWTPY